MNLTRNFTLEELTLSDTAARLRIKNEPDAAKLANLKVLAEALQRLRGIMAAPMTHLKKKQASHKQGRFCGL